MPTGPDYHRPLWLLDSTLNDEGPRVFILRGRSIERIGCRAWIEASQRPKIMAVLGMGRAAVWRTRGAYLQGGVDLAVFDVARSGRPRQYDTDAEARVTALACSAPPEGRQRWTLVELNGLLAKSRGWAA